ncbi:MAG TPA: hypothetical protein VFX59_06265 [Polyangiales bacterium]|nr:hypothetical protein [Polyangiales bacterium]
MNGWSWLRVLLPSWRFFDSVAAPLALWVESAGSWREVDFPHQHGTFLNPRGNLSLLLYSTLERLLLELAEDSVNPEQLTSYLLVRNLAAQGVQGAYRFEIRDRAQTLLSSPWYQKGPL